MLGALTIEKPGSVDMFVNRHGLYNMAINTNHAPTLANNGTAGRSDFLYEIFEWS